MKIVYVYQDGEREEHSCSGIVSPAQMVSVEPPWRPGAEVNAIEVVRDEPTYEVVVTLRVASAGEIEEDVKGGIVARLDSYNGGAGEDWVYPEILSVEAYFERDRDAGAVPHQSFFTRLQQGDGGLADSMIRARSAERGIDLDSPAGAGSDVEAERG